MTKKVLTTPVSDADIESLKIGDVFYLSGALITSRDMVHFRHVEEGMDLPYDLAGKAIFHAGPIMVPDDKSRSGFRVVSIGPTTSMRMEKYEREFLRKTGVKIVVGKGGMGPNRVNAYMGVSPRGVWRGDVRRSVEGPDAAARHGERAREAHPLLPQGVRERGGESPGRGQRDVSAGDSLPADGLRVEVVEAVDA